MMITAKFSTTCPSCHKSISVGAKVEWAKGSPARHAACASSAPARSASTSSRRPSQSPVERTYRRRYGWDGVRGSSSYYSSGMYDEES